MKNISEFYQNFWETQLFYLKDDALFELEWNDFIKVVSIMNIKTCGTKIEQRILKSNGWIKIQGYSSHGDGLKSDGTVVEIKSSIISPLPGSSVTFRGIRPHHDISEYIFILIDLRQFKESPITHIFKLTKNDILNEKDIFKTLRPYNMKKADREKNVFSELGTSFKNGDLERWIKQYSPTEKIVL